MPRLSQRQPRFPLLVIRWPGDHVAVFDQHGAQMSELQGRYRDVKAAVLAAATPATRFEHRTWDTPYFGLTVTREEW